MTLLILLIAAVVTSVVLGLMARLNVLELAGQTLAMIAAALVFYGLVGLLA